MYLAKQEGTERQEQFANAREAAKWLWKTKPSGKWKVFFFTKPTKRKTTVATLEFEYETLV
jgi:hypothetical protein